MLDNPEFNSLFNTKPLKSGVTCEDIVRDVIEPSRRRDFGHHDHPGGAPGPQAA
jgi:hypothetical protein